MLETVLIAPLFAAVGIPQAAPAARPTSSAVEKKVCRRIAETQSRILPPPVCKTQAEWDAEARAQSEDIRRTRNRNQNPGN